MLVGLKRSERFCKLLVAEKIKFESKNKEILKISNQSANRFEENLEDF